MSKKYTIQEVACKINRSVETINNWYAFKRKRPNDRYAKLLPSYIQLGNRQTRYWDDKGIKKLKDFIKIIPIGRNGAMGCISQRYYK